MRSIQKAIRTYHLQSDFCDFERVRHDHLASSGRTSRHNFHEQRDSTRLRVRRLLSHEVVDGKFDGLLRSDTDKLRHDTTVERPHATFIRVHLLHAVPGVSVQDLANDV